jgi:hypothetical protein
MTRLFEPEEKPQHVRDTEKKLAEALKKLDEVLEENKRLKELVFLYRKVEFKNS